MADEFRSMIEHAVALTGQYSSSIRIECSNLETIYIMQSDDGRLLVFDRWHASSYLTDEHADTHRTLAEIGIPYVENLCAKHDVSWLKLDHDDTDECGAIGAYATSDAEVVRCVDSVSACLDELFAHTLRDGT